MTIDVAFQGILGANSEIAAKLYFANKRIKCHAVPKFENIYQKVVRGHCEYGMVPIENSLAGSIHENYDLLIKNKVWICGEHIHHVEHHLLGTKTSSLKDIKTIVSHPQALLQCAGFLRSLKRAESHPYFDTAGSAKHVKDSGDKTLAAIASKEAAAAHGLKILKRGIEDNVENYTRFFVIAKNQPKRFPKGKYKTSIVFALKNIPGALHKSLSVFALRDIDLLKIESRPIHGSPWKYLFYLDYIGHIHDEASERALGHLQELTQTFRVLGSYQIGKQLKR